MELLQCERSELSGQTVVACALYASGSNLANNLSAGAVVSKNQNTTEKRRREMEKKRKAEEKRQKRRVRKERDDETPPAPLEQDVSDNS